MSWRVIINKATRTRITSVLTLSSEENIRGHIRQLHDGVEACVRMTTGSSWYPSRLLRDCGKDACCLRCRSICCSMRRLRQLSIDAARSTSSSRTLLARRGDGEGHGNTETPLGRIARAVRRTLTTDDAGGVSKSPDCLVRVMAATVRVFGAFGLLMPVPIKSPQMGKPPTTPPPPLVLEAAGQTYAHTTKLRYSGGLITEGAKLTNEINNWRRFAGVCIKTFSREVID